MSSPCVKCKIVRCPIGNRPLVCELPEGFNCENLVELYQIFRIIGGYVKDEKVKQDNEAISKSLSYFG